MKNHHLVLISSILVISLSGCAKGNVSKPHFKRFGSLVTSQYFESKLKIKLNEFEKMFSTTYANTISSRQNELINFRYEVSSNYKSNVPASYVIRGLSEGKVHLDYMNNRFEIKNEAKTYIKNNLKNSEYLESIGLKEGTEKTKNHYYGESNGNETVLVDLEFGKIEQYETIYQNDAYYGLSGEISHLLYLDFYSGSNQNASTYMNGENTFTYIVKSASTSNHENFLSESTYQVIFNKNIKIL